MNFFLNFYEKIFKIILLNSFEEGLFPFTWFLLYIILWMRGLTLTWSGKSYWRERLSTVDLLVLTSSDLLLLYWKYYFLSLTNQATLMRRSTVLSLPPLLVFHALMYFSYSGEEILVNYNYSVSLAPEWYKDLWFRHLRYLGSTDL